MDTKRIKPAEQWPYSIVSEKSDERLGLICGFLGCDLRPFNPLLTALPKVMVVSDEQGAKNGWLGQFTQLALAEASANLTDWRMQFAVRMLFDGADDVATVAIQVGYESEAAFNRAFKKFVGMPPATWRRQRAGAT